MKRKIPQIADAEWKIMEVAWENPPVTAQDVLDRIGEAQNWKIQTIKTLIGRLVKKGALRFEEKGNRYWYRPEIDRDTAVANAAGTFLDRISAGSIAPLFSHLVNAKRSLSPEELDSLRVLLESETHTGEDES